MPFEIPYTFIAGQTAKAAEVNSNFLGVKQFVDLLEQNSAQNELDIAILEGNKANINGNSGYRFQVANAINTMDAVNLNTFNDLTANSKYYIGGFELSKQSTTSIRATAGSCWDSTYQEMITSIGTLTLNTSSAGDNVTRYIFVVWNADTMSAQLVMSVSSSTPTLPSGYDYYRRIGQFTTDENGNIQSVTKDGQFNVTTQTGTNGYLTFPNGLTFQWGTVNGFPDSNEHTIQFQKAFNTACYQVQISSNLRDLRADRKDRLTILGFNTTSVTLKVDADSSECPNGRYQDVRAYWFAIGV